MSEPTVNIHEAKTHLSRLLERVEAGEELVIARAGRPVARLVPFRQRTTPREPGVWRGSGTLADEFDRTPETLLDDFDRRSCRPTPTPSSGGSPTIRPFTAAGRP